MNKIKGIALIVLTTYFLLTILVILESSYEKYGNFWEHWMGLIAAIIGGVISGGLTLAGVYIGILHERKTNLTMRFLQNADKINDLEDWLKSTLYLVKNIGNREKEVEIGLLELYAKQCDKYSKSMLYIDLELGEYLIEYKTELLGFKYSLEFMDNEDEMIKVYSENYHIENYDSFKKLNYKITDRYKKIKDKLI